MEIKKDEIVRLVAYLDKLGIKKLDIEKNYNDRVVAQKVAYLMWSLIGSPITADFKFNIKGPYSHDLTVGYFSHKREFQTESDYRLNEKEVAWINKIKNVMKDSLDADILEIVASLLFLLKRTGSYEEAEKELHVRKPHLSTEAIWQGSNILKTLLLDEKDRDAQMNSINTEMELLDSVSDAELNKFAQ